jgi:FKBP-type peptidyl-prolyl cis-trans isomerase FkpA
MKKYITFLAVAALAVNASAQGTFQKTAKGTEYQMLTHNTGDRIKLNDIITFNAMQTTGKDSILFSSYKAGAPLQAQIQPDGDLMDIFPLLTVKDSVLVRIPTDSIFKNNEAQRPPFLPKGSSMFFRVKIERVQSLEEAIAERKVMMDKAAAEETANTAKYIADNKLVLTTTASGLKYKITKPSLLRKPLTGDTVYVNYTGRTLDGKIFDTSIAADAEKAGLSQPRVYEPIHFALGVDPIITGWVEGLALMGQGAKAQLVIPSSLGYGDKGQGDEIKPFSTLLFDVELVKVKPVKHAPAKTAAKKGAAKPAATKPGASKPAAKKPAATTTKKG